MKWSLSVKNRSKYVQVHKVLFPIENVNNLKFTFPNKPKNDSMEQFNYQIKLNKYQTSKWVKKIERNQIRERSGTSNFTNDVNIELLTQIGVQLFPCSAYATSI